MSYRCTNKECKDYMVEKDPGGIIAFINGEAIFTGSKCNKCKKEMEKCSISPPTSFVINNPGDGRNL